MTRSSLRHHAWRWALLTAVTVSLLVSSPLFAFACGGSSGGSSTSC